MANNNTKHPTRQPPDLPTLQSSLTRLSTAAHLLDGFVRRNKNQHRGTRWWGPFDMLRRSVRKLIPDLEGAVRRTELSASASSSAGPAKRRKTNDKRQAATKAKQPELGRVEVRAQWVHDVIAVNAYEAFTQLLADRQFAQLGLMLIGVLAQAEAALTPFLRPADSCWRDGEGEGEAGQDPAQAPVAAGIASRQLAGGPTIASQAGGCGTAGSRALGGVQHDDDDLGVAVSRDELGGEDMGSEEAEVISKEPRRSSPPAAVAAAPEQTLSEERRPRKNERKGNKRPRTDDTASPGLGKPEKTTQPDLASRDEKKAKKKKKKKGGDEFDDLFSSLV